MYLTIEIVAIVSEEAELDTKLIRLLEHARR